MNPELKTTLNALIVVIGFALSPVIGMAQQAPAGQSQTQYNTQQQNSNPGQSTASSPATQGGSVQAHLTRKTNVHGTSDRSSKPRYVPTGGGDKGGPARARANNLIETAQTDSSDSASPAAGGGDKSIDAQGAVNLASPSLASQTNMYALAQSPQTEVNNYFVYVATKLEKRVEDGCYATPAYNDADSVSQYTCDRLGLEYVHQWPLEKSGLNQESYEASLIVAACSKLAYGPEQVLCYQTATQGSQSAAILNLNTSCVNAIDQYTCYTDTIKGIASEPSTLNFDSYQQINTQR